MILASLRELAHRERLLENPDYEPKPVAWIVAINESGAVVHLIPTSGDDSPGKKRRPKVLSIPRRKGRTSGASADFLVDKSEYVLGIGKSPEESLRVRLRLFREAVERAHAATNNDALEAVLRFLADEDQRRRVAEMAGEYASNDLFAFEYEGKLVHDAPEIREYFSASRRGVKEGGSQCLICGNEGAIAKKHPSVQVPGGTTSGVALVSFNADAFESYGRDGNDNAPVCQDCADAYTTALKRLLSDRYPNPKHPGETMPRRYVRLSADTTAVYWADGEASIVNRLPDYFDTPRVEDVKELIESARKGNVPSGAPIRFYCLILSGGQGRAILRGTHTATIREIEQNVLGYFGSISIQSEQPLPLWALMKSLVLQGKLENLPPDLVTDVFLAVIFGREFPQTLLARAVGRCRAEQRVTRERAAVLRAYLIRNLEQEVSVGLDSDNVRPGYRLGRLMSVLERIQGAAQNNPNKTIVDRYYGAASTRPATVFPRLIALAQHHLAKLDTGLQVYYQRGLADVMNSITVFPTTLSLEEQGLFALGYYHQRQDFFTKQPAETDGKKGEAA